MNVLYLKPLTQTLAKWELSLTSARDPLPRGAPQPCLASSSTSLTAASSSAPHTLVSSAAWMFDPTVFPGPASVATFDTSTFSLLKLPPFDLVFPRLSYFSGFWLFHRSLPLAIRGWGARRP